MQLGSNQHHLVPQGPLCRGLHPPDAVHFLYCAVVDIQLKLLLLSRKVGETHRHLGGVWH
jgi:hypothetical protein